MFDDVDIVASLAVAVPYIHNIIYYLLMRQTEQHLGQCTRLMCPIVCSIIDISTRTAYVYAYNMHGRHLSLEIPSQNCFHNVPLSWPTFLNSYQCQLWIDWCRTRHPFCTWYTWRAEQISRGSHEKIHTRWTIIANIVFHSSLQLDAKPFTFFRCLIHVWQRWT